MLFEVVRNFVVAMAIGWVLSLSRSDVLYVAMFICVAEAMFVMAVAIVVSHESNKLSQDQSNEEQH